MKALLTYLDRPKRLLRRILPHRWLAALKSLWAGYSFRYFKPRVVRHRYGAYDFTVRLIDFDGESWLDKDYDGSAFAELELLKRNRLRPGARVFNVGANQCLQAMMMANEVAPHGVVYAVEPNRHNIEAGKQNCELNRINNVKLIEAAASSKPGQVLFNQAMNGQVVLDSSEPGAHLVDVVTVDDLAAKFGPPDVLYVDVEGFECEVLQGAKRTLEATTPDCFVEVHLQMGLERYGGSVTEVLSYLPSATYELFYSNGEDGVFRQMKTDAILPDRRFYLVAIRRADASPEVTADDAVETPTA